MMMGAPRRGQGAVPQSSPASDAREGDGRARPRRGLGLRPAMKRAASGTGRHAVHSRSGRVADPAAMEPDVERSGDSPRRRPGNPQYGAAMEPGAGEKPRTRPTL